MRSRGSPQVPVFNIDERRRLALLDLSFEESRQAPNPPPTESDSELAGDDAEDPGELPAGHAGLLDWPG
jgi:hypothetical protein